MSWTNLVIRGRLFSCKKVATYSSLHFVQFTEPPVFQEHPQASIQVTEAQIATIRCVVTAEPLPTISWRFNGVTLNNNSRGGRVSYTSVETVKFELTSILTITNADYHVDRGQYSCYASNSQGVINATTTLDVYSKTEFPSSFSWIPSLL